MDRYDYKMIWWNWFCCSPKYWGYGLTLKKLSKLKDSIFDNSFIWNDLFDRHSMRYVMPWKAMGRDIDNYNHAIGNFAGMIYEKAVLYKLIRTK